MNPFFPEIKGRFGFGCMRLPMDGEQVNLLATKKMVDTFLQRGFNYFDTAHGYIGGQSEQAVRTCLTSRYPRDRYILTDKLTRSFYNSREEIEPFCRQQLEICGVEYFDFYLLHAMNAKYYEEMVPMGVFEEVQRLKQLGLVRHVGMSFHDSAQVLDRILTEHPELEAVQIQYNYADFLDPVVQSRDCYDVCRAHGKPVIVMEPVKGGSLVNLPPEALEMMTGGSPASYAIRFAANPPGMMMVLSGMSNQAQMEDNLSFMADFQPLKPEEMEIIDRVRTLYQGLHRIPCTACRYCADGCPAEIPIPEIFAAVNSLRQGKEYDPALFSQAENCLKCGRCERVCPQHLHIRQLLEQAARLA